MKALFVACVVVVLSAVASVAPAQEAYSFTAPSNYVTRLNRQRIKWNASVCARVNPALPSTCTQGQACLAAGVTGGAACTVANARLADVEIFADSLVGRQTFLLQKGLRVLIDIIWKSEDAITSHIQQCINFRAASQAGKDAMCAAAGPPIPASDCDLCD